MKSLSDIQLIRLFQQGNQLAFEELFHRHKDKIFTSVSVLIKDRQLAEDLFHDVLIKIINNLRGGKYKEENKFLPWAMRLAHNICIDHFRGLRYTVNAYRTQTITKEDADDLKEFDLRDFAPSDCRADKALNRKENVHLVHQLIDQLPLHQREVVAMRHFAGLTFKEIARLTNCSVNTALGRMRYALINLRRAAAKSTCN